MCRCVPSAGYSRQQWISQLAQRRWRERDEQLGDDTCLRKRPHVDVDALQVEQHAHEDLAPRRTREQRGFERRLVHVRFEQAAALGVANAALPADEVLSAALATARQLAALPPSAVQASKALMRHHGTQELQDTIAREAQAFGDALQSAEAKAAFAAFLRR